MAIIFEHRLNAIQVHASTDIQFPPHVHSEIEIVYVTAGAITLINEGEKRVLEQGELAVIFSNCVHEYLKETTGEMTLMILNTQLVPEFSPLFSKKRPTDFVIKSDAFRPEMALINQFFLHTDHHENETLSRAYIHLLFALISKNLTLESRQATVSPSLEVSVITYVSEQFNTPLTLDSIAQEVGCSEYTVSRVFSHKINISFSNYVNQLRVDYARRLLRETDMKILEISSEAGFDSLRSFNRAYQRHYDETPSHYRKVFLEG